jgi:hypothetical protein
MYDFTILHNNCMRTVWGPIFRYPISGTIRTVEFATCPDETPKGTLLQPLVQYYNVIAINGLEVRNLFILTF